MCRGEATVGVGPEPLEVRVANVFGVCKNPLSDRVQPAVCARVDRGQEGFELRLHFRFADERRTQAADDLEEQRVGVSVGDQGCVRSPDPRFGQEMNLAQACAPRRGVRRRWSGARSTVEQRQAHEGIL